MKIWFFSKAPLILDTSFWTSFMQFLSVNNFQRPIFSHLIPYCFFYMTTRTSSNPTKEGPHELTIFSTSFTHFLSFNDFHFFTVSVIWSYLLLQTTAVQPAEQHAPARPTRQNQLQGDLEETVREQIKNKYLWNTVCVVLRIRYFHWRVTLYLFSVDVLVYA